MIEVDLPLYSQISPVAPVAASAVTLTRELPPALTLLGYRVTDGSCAGTNTPVWTVPILGAGAVFSVAIILGAGAQWVESISFTEKECRSRNVLDRVLRDRNMSASTPFSIRIDPAALQPYTA